jgi:hypothetical protein
MHYLNALCNTHVLSSQSPRWMPHTPENMLFSDIAQRLRRRQDAVPTAEADR